MSKFLIIQTDIGFIVYILCIYIGLQAYQKALKLDPLTKAQ